MRIALTLLVLALAMAGCASPTPPADAAMGESLPSVDAAAESADPVAAPEDPAPPAVVELSGTSHFEAGVGRPCGTGTRACATGMYGPSAEFAVKEAAPVRVTLVATWTPSGALAETLHVRVWRDGTEAMAEDIAATSGTSPLTLDLPVEAFEKPSLYHAHAIPDTAKVVIDQRVEYVLRLEYA